MTLGAIDLLIDSASAHHASLVERTGHAGTFSVVPPLPSGAPGPEYLLRITADGSWIKAAEVQPTRLPAFCPERHISLGGAFCLHWAEEEDLDVRDEAGAAAWWGKLLVFLLRQETASVVRRWPGRSDARAHGPNAARQQAAAERLADALGLNFAANLRAERFDVASRQHRGENRLRLMLDGRRIATVLEGTSKPLTLRERCKCDEAALPIRSCANHAEILAEFVIALHGWKSENKRFFAAAKRASYTCCGSLDDCPLAA